MRSSTIDAAEVMGKYRVIAVVGASKNPMKEANTVPQYLKNHGYQIVPINPTSEEILGEKAFASLADLPEALARRVEVVEVFRPSEELPAVADQVVQMRKLYQRPFVFWSQSGLENDLAKATLDTNGIPYVMNACMRVVHASMSDR